MTSSGTDPFGTPPFVPQQRRHTRRTLRVCVATGIALATALHVADQWRETPTTALHAEDRPRGARAMLVAAPIAAAQAPIGTPWPIVTAAITPPDLPVPDRGAEPRPTAAPLPPVNDGDPADGIARPHTSTIGYLVAGILGAIGAAMYGWSAWQRLRQSS